AATMVAEVGITVRAESEKRPRPDRSGAARRLTPDLIVLMRDANPTVREEAARALSQINPDATKVVPALEAMLESDAASSRRAAALALGTLIQNVALLIEAKGKSITGIQATPQDVVKTGALVVPAAAKGTKDADVSVRRLSVDAIQKSATALSDL